MLIVACDPIEIRQELGPIVTADQIDLEVKGSTPGSNQVIVINHTPQYGGVWDLISAKSSQDIDTIEMIYLGVDSFKFAAITDGGIVNINKPYEVTKIDFPPFPEWTLLAGTTNEGKTWVWAFDSPKLQGFGPWGNGSFLSTTIVPTKGAQSTDGSDYEGAQNDEMTFDLNNNAANFTLVSHNTGANGMKAGTFKGNFKFDTKKAVQKFRADSTVWSLGTLKFSGGDKPTISRGFSPSEKNKLITSFDVISVTENELILGYVPKTSLVAGDDAMYWVFKPKK
jgi:hypothetical protein